MTNSAAIVTHQNNELLTAFEASQYLKINDGSIDSLKPSRRTGLLWHYPAPKFIKASRKVLYKKSELDAFLDRLPTMEKLGAVA